MPNRITAKRYASLEVRDRLAAQYVLGTLTPRVRRRLEQLIQQDPTWWESIAHWQKHFSGLTPSMDDLLDEQGFSPAPKKVWEHISFALFPSTQRDAPNLAKNQRSRLWPTWFTPVGFACALMLGLFLRPIVSTAPLIPTSESTQTTSLISLVQPAAYFAMMSSNIGENQFALVAYKGTKPGESTIRLQRNLRETNLPSETAMVWMRDKASGKLQPIDTLRRINDTRVMSPTEWKVLKNSSELLVTETNDPSSTLLYRGDNVELSNWNAI
ncbi:hypothetical protein [Enterovibrio norvegicus]|uniref:Anti-sigma-K factor RskA n=1 Tax=Enterovibrio norvegicus DSM 15893 TaxID=1121869 RepID=A0A1I5SNT4_9GAMM|nr:hypothetical protein [Enterovibrio norvegicus]OEF56240.1 hypothetical protein A1OU_15835 [Enterovibrio norvegicus]SFP72422.1 hypothetical protein SAMN03084138_02945 [Enterovibrio norvegicus DSM 15893]